MCNSRLNTGSAGNGYGGLVRWESEHLPAIKQKVIEVARKTHSSVKARFSWSSSPNPWIKKKVGTTH